MVQKVKERVKIEDILMAHNCMKDIVIKTPLQRDTVLSEKYDCDVYVKREDLQLIRSFKIRGAYNLIQSLSKEQLQNGVVCASAGNHAQGVAYTCNLLKIPSKIFMPTTTPKQKYHKCNFSVVILQKLYWLVIHLIALSKKRSAIVRKIE